SAAEPSRSTGITLLVEAASDPWGQNADQAGAAIGRSLAAVRRGLGSHGSKPEAEWLEPGATRSVGTRSTGLGACGRAGTASTRPLGRSAARRGAVAAKNRALVGPRRGACHNA